MGWVEKVHTKPRQAGPGSVVGCLRKQPTTEPGKSHCGPSRLPASEIWHRQNSDPRWPDRCRGVGAGRGVGAREQEGAGEQQKRRTLCALPQVCYRRDVLPMRTMRMQRLLAGSGIGVQGDGLGGQGGRGGGAHLDVHLQGQAGGGRRRSKDRRHGNMQHAGAPRGSQDGFQKPWKVRPLRCSEVRRTFWMPPMVILVV